MPVGLRPVWGCQLGPHRPYISRGGGSAPLSCPSVPGEVGGTCHSPPGGWGHCGSRLWVQGRLVPAALGTRGAPSWQPGPLPSGIYLLPQIPPAAGGCPGCVGGGGSRSPLLTLRQPCCWGGWVTPGPTPKMPTGGFGGTTALCPAPKRGGWCCGEGVQHPLKLVSGCRCRPHPKFWASQSCWSPESPRVAWATAGRMGRCRAAVGMETGRAVALVMAPIHPAPKGAGGALPSAQQGPGGCRGC